MRALALALCLLAGQAWGAYATGTTALYDLENNVLDELATYNGTVISALTYSTANPWHGLRAGGGGGYFSIPTATVSGGAGTVQFSFYGLNNTQTTSLFSIATAGGTRALEIYHSGSNLYVYSNATGQNTIIKSGLGLTSLVYVKTTWNGSLWRVYTGDWTVPGTVTLTEATAAGSPFTCPNVTTPTSVGVCGSVAIGVPFNGYLDWVRTMNAYDPTAAVTVDPVAPTLPAGWVLVNGLVKTQ